MTPYIVHQSKNILTLRLFALTLVMGILVFIGIFVLSDFEIDARLGVLALLSSDALIALVSLVLYLIFAAQAYLNWKYYYFEIKDREIIFYQGIILKRKRIYVLENIEAVQCVQALFGRWMKYGTIEIKKRFVPEDEIIPYVPDPQIVQEALFQAARSRGSTPM